MYSSFKVADCSQDVMPHDTAVLLEHVHQDQS
jgi:hypothetical protein